MADPAVHAFAACFLLISFLLSSDSATSIQCRNSAVHSRQHSAEWPCPMSLMDDKTPLLWHLAPSSPTFAEAQSSQTTVMPAYFLCSSISVVSWWRVSYNEQWEIFLSKNWRGSHWSTSSARWTLLHSLCFWQLCSPLCLSSLHLGWVLRDSNHVSAVSHNLWWLKHESGRREEEPRENLMLFSCHTRRVGRTPAGVQHSRGHPCLGQMDPPLATQTAGVTWTAPQLLLTSEHCRCGRRGIKLQ